MHRPVFPPRRWEWMPTQPKDGPPLPRFMTNPRSIPWLPFNEQQQIASKYGWWATNRAQGMVAPISGVNEVEKVAQKMYNILLARYA